jgi:hypothetical protein
VSYIGLLAKIPLVFLDTVGVSRVLTSLRPSSLSSLCSRLASDSRETARLLTDDDVLDLCCVLRDGWMRRNKKKRGDMEGGERREAGRGSAFSPNRSEQILGELAMRSLVEAEDVSPTVQLATGQSLVKSASSESAGIALDGSWA